MGQRGTATVLLNHRCNDTASVHRADARTSRLSLRRRVTDLKALERHPVTLLKNSISHRRNSKEGGAGGGELTVLFVETARRGAPKDPLKTTDSVGDVSLCVERMRRPRAGDWRSRRQQHARRGARSPSRYEMCEFDLRTSLLRRFQTTVGAECHSGASVH